MSDTPGVIRVSDGEVVEHVDADGVRKIVREVLSSYVAEFSAYLVHKGKMLFIDQVVPGGNLLDLQRQILDEWLEDDATKTIVIQGMDKRVVSVMQTCGKSRNCAIIDVDGGYGMFQVEYELNAKGEYQRTKVREMLM